MNIVRPIIAYYNKVIDIKEFIGWIERYIDLQNGIVASELYEISKSKSDEANDEVLPVLIKKIIGADVSRYPYVKGIQLADIDNPFNAEVGEVLQNLLLGELLKINRIKDDEKFFSEFNDLDFKFDFPALLVHLPKGYILDNDSPSRNEKYYKYINDSARIIRQFIQSINKDKID